MTLRPLTPATLAFTGGAPCALDFVSCNDQDGSAAAAHTALAALETARGVFIHGTRLVPRWQQRRRFTVLETGFGLGLNFLATWQAWRDDPLHCQRLHYVAIEKHPFRPADLAQLHQRWPELGALSAELLAAWPPLVPGFHRILLAHGQVQLTLVFGDIGACLRQIDAGSGFDAFYLDGFAPEKNPDMWSARTLARTGRLAAADATLASSSAAPEVRATLTTAGFVCEQHPGLAGTPPVLTAHYAPRWPIPQHREPERAAIVIGAGLAGCSISQRLCARGWKVSLIERHGRPAQEISGNRAGIALPRLSQDDNPGSRMGRAAFLFAQRIAREIGGIGVAFDGEACGVLQLAADPEQAQAWRGAAQAFPDAPEFVQWLEPQAIETRFGMRAEHGGWLFSQGGWATPSRFCTALLAACGTGLEHLFETEVAGLQRVGEIWQVQDAAGRVIASAPTVILANGNGATLLPQAASLPLWRVRGQVTHVSADLLPALPLVVCGEAYITRPAQGTVCVGATYDLDDDPELRVDSQLSNLEALARTLPELGPIAQQLSADLVAQLQRRQDPAPSMTPSRAPSTTPFSSLSGRVGFRCVTPDRLPLVGALPDPALPIAGSRPRDVPRLPGVFGLLGYGSRGLIWAPYCAELLASRLEGEPLPIEHELAVALDPARFALKAHRRAHPSGIQ